MRRSYSAAGTFSLSLSRLYIEKPPGDIHRWRRTNLVVTGLWLLAFVQSPAKDSAVKARTQAINQMKALVVTAPAGLRETLDGLTASALTARCRSFRPGRLEDPTAAAKYTLRSLACRYLQLDKDIRSLQAELDRLTRMAAPAVVSIFGVGPDTAAALVISAGSNPERIHSEAAFASLCGLSKTEVIRCLKRYVAREVFSALKKSPIVPSGHSLSLKLVVDQGLFIYGTQVS